MNNEMKERIVERAARHGVLLDRDDPAMLFADIAMLVADDRASEVTKTFEKDVQPAKDILAQFENLSAAIGGEESGLVHEIQTSIRTMEDAIADLGGAYDTEQEAAKRLEAARDEIRDLSGKLIEDLRGQSGELRKMLTAMFHETIGGESKNIVESLTKSLRFQLVNDVSNESVRHVLGEKVEEASKAALAKRVNELEARESVYKQHYKEANFWRGASRWLVALSIVGGASLAALVAVVYFSHTGAIQIVY